jgi:hypothetical protein
VIQEQLGEQADVLTVDLVDAAIDLEHGQIVLAIDFIAWRMTQRTLLLLVRIEMEEKKETKPKTKKKRKEKKKRRKFSETTNK